MFGRSVKYILGYYLSLIMAENIFCQMTGLTAISYFATHPGKKRNVCCLLRGRPFDSWGGGAMVFL